MPTESDIYAMIETLSRLVTEAEGGDRQKWKDAWVEIKTIGQAFKSVRFSTVQQRQEAWEKYQCIVEGFKESQLKAKEAAQEEMNELQGLLDSLNALADDAAACNRWGDVWAEIKSIGQAFKKTRFPTPKDRQEAWAQYQKIIDKVKASQKKAKAGLETRVQESERHLAELRSYAYSAEPPSDWADVIIALATGGLSVIAKLTLEAIFGPWDEKKMELQSCSENMKAGWDYFKEHKAEMFRQHKDEAFGILKKAQDVLDAAWEKWRTGRQRAIDEYREEKRAKREAWEEKIRENISNLEERIARLEGVLEHKRGHLSELEEKRDSASNDDFRDRVEGWISEEEERISDIESEIDKIKGWIDENRSKLNWA